MKKVLGSLAVLATIIFTGCGDDKVTLEQVIQKKGEIKKGMTSAQVRALLKRGPDDEAEIGEYDFWTYEGVVVNPDDETDKKYKNLIIRFKNDKVDYKGYFGCKLPSVKE